MNMAEELEWEKERRIAEERACKKPEQPEESETPEWQKERQMAEERAGKKPEPLHSTEDQSISNIIRQPD